MRNFILYKVLKKIIILINEIVREFNEIFFKTIKKIFEYENRKFFLKILKNLNN